MSGLHVDDDELAACVSCGLCLPHCPTYLVTGDEAASPRGRIAAMRVANEGLEPVADRLAEVLDACVGCRGCETACPSGVEYGHLLEGALRSLHESGRRPPWWLRAGLALLDRPAVLAAGRVALAVGQRLRLTPRRLGLPPLELRSAPLAPTGHDVWLHTGCVMDAWMRQVHRDAIEVLATAGRLVALPGPEASCCGALDLHSGRHQEARRRAERTMRAFPGEAPILVDSAGCGAALKSYGHLLGTPESRRFAARVRDIHEVLAEDVVAGRLAPPEPLPTPVAVQDPCHLRHAQRVHGAVRTVLRAAASEVVELDDLGLCCGAGGSYAVRQPQMARAIRERKLGAIRRSGAAVVASANPGCLMHLMAAGLDVRHPVSIVAEALRAAGPVAGSVDGR